MKVAILYQYYKGHGEPGHSLVYELSQYLAERGHDVIVVSGETGYMRTGTPHRPWYRRLMSKERDNGVEVIRTYTYTKLHRSYFGRLLGFLSFTLSCPLALFSIRKPDVVLASSPPLFPVFAALIVCKIRRIPFVTEVRDLWPASAVEMGLLSNSKLIALMSWMERVLYDRSARIVALTEGIRDDICVRGWPKSKVELVTCGVDQDHLHPDPERGAAVRARYGWRDKRVMMYFGALGEANNLPVILRAAERLRSRDDIIFVLVGDGMYRAKAEEMRAAKGLSNFVILPPVPKNEARAFLSAADLCLVTLRNIPLFRGVIPTKLIDYMACGRPVLCGVLGEAQRLVEEAGVGYVFDPDDEAQLCDLALRLLAEPDVATSLGMKGVGFVGERFSAPIMRKRMEEILSDVAARKPGRSA